MRALKLLSILVLTMICSSSVSFGQNQLKKIFVAGHYGQCHSLNQSKCLLIRDSAKSEWINHFGNIEGFKYEEGNEYELIVEVHTTKNSADDTTSYHLALSKILVKKKIKLHDHYKLDDEPWFLTKLNIDKKLKKVSEHHVFLVIHDDENMIVGNSGCNKFKASIEVNGQEVKVSKLDATKAICKGSLGNIEKVFLEELQVATKYNVKGKQLLVYQGSSLLMIFTRK